MASHSGPSTHRTIGFIGLGVMGQPMASHLIRHLGHTTTVHIHNRDVASAAPLLDAGAIWHDTPRTLAAAGCDTIIVMVPAMAHVLETLEGPDGILAAAPSDVVLAISSTVSAGDVTQLSERLTRETQSAVRVVDAPVSGGEQGALAGTLSILIGGADPDVARVQPLYATMGTATHLGAIGAGQIAKACNQVIVAATVTALAEAALLAERAGLDVLAMFDALGPGYAGSTILESKKARFATHDDSPSGPAKFMIKDLGAALDIATSTSTDTPLTALLADLFADLTASGLGDRDTSTMMRYLANRSSASGQDS